MWLRGAQPADARSSEQNITLPEVPHGALMGVISFPAGASDRRGQAIKPGVYTMRYSQFPITGDHQGVAPQRDFLILSPLSEDKDGEANLKFDALMAMSRKGSGTTHPLILRLWKADQPQRGLSKEGEHDWVPQRQIGKLPLAGYRANGGPVRDLSQGCSIRTLCSRGSIFEQSQVTLTSGTT